MMQEKGEAVICALTVLKPETCCRIVEVEDRRELDRLKSMGLCLGRTVEVVKSGDPLIVRVYGTRIGLSARLAEHVKVSPCSHAPRCWERGICMGEEAGHAG